MSKSLLALLVLVASLAAVAQDASARFVLQVSAPVRWASMAACGFGDDLTYGYLRNFSDKEVTAVQEGWVSFVGSVDPHLVQAYDVSLGPITKIDIAAQSQSPEVGLGLWAQGLRAKAKAQNASRAVAAVGIVHVEFADGSEWNYNLQADPSFNNDLEFRVIEAFRCEVPVLSCCNQTD